MSGDTPRTRRGFLAESAKLAAATGLASAVGCSMAERGPVLTTTAGPKPRSFSRDAKINLAVIGLGNRWHLVFSELLEADRNLGVKAIVDPRQDNVDRALKTIGDALHDKPEVYRGPEDYLKVLARDDVDAVMISVPNYLHTTMYLAAFAAGKHFYGEKPMSITVNEAHAMVEAQEKNPEITAQIGFQRRATTLYQKGIEMIRDGAVGRILDCRGAWDTPGGPMGTVKSGPRIWFGRRKFSGDWMLDQACHTWDVFNWVAGKLPIAASGVGYKDVYTDIDPGRDVTDLYYAHLEYPEFHVDYEHSWICPHNDLYSGDRDGLFSGVFERVGGTKGGIALERGKLFFRDKNKQPVQYIDGTFEPGWTRESIVSFMHALRNHTPVVSGVRNGRDATLVALMVRKAVDEHRRVTTKEIVG